MLPAERRTAASLALIYMVRMLGLFIILPVFALFSADFENSTPFLMGLALGIYGLLQALLQIPFGLLSDRIGRKKTITIGLILMAIGSVIAAMSDSIYGVILGRALQGSGAIAAALMALAADLTRDEQRTKMMAMLGASIGFSFIVALILGPVLISVFSISTLFWFTGATAIIAIVILHTIVPDPTTSGYRADTSTKVASLKQLFVHPQLRRLNASIFFLHMLITASFVAVPLMLLDGGMDKGAHWKVYLPAMLLSVLFMVPMIVVAERYRRMRLVMLLCVIGMLLTQLLFAVLPNTLFALLISVVLFFCFLNTLESLLPSLVSRLAPAGSRGGASGVYASCQFFGAFIGGAGGGWLLGTAGFSALFLGLAGVCLLWFAVLFRFQPPAKLASHRRPLSAAEVARGPEIQRELAQLPGVEEVYMSLEEGAAY
ncbi:UNVERIFIED_CONTAM: hypothetical protein GTU68_008979, partial [Idotea baltica]|nr:hypothetical protein [Idotea baltica]